MPYIPFYSVCPQTAMEETKAITIQDTNNEFGLPQGQYYFTELFCDECDCRRVLLQVYLGQEIVATIGYGWDKLSFYKKEFLVLGEKEIISFKGPSLDIYQTQSKSSNKIFNMYKKLLFSDKGYLDRIEKHYLQFRKVLEHYT
ncbi:hypothetical protein RCC89_05515 [Cytophagaceae bacterium ABcell3]|nr:hypothetical protein RCC89_05515 [Cytophagaceae bacterium ABcell3]